MAHEDLGNDTCIVHGGVGGGSQQLGPPRVLSALEFRPCLCRAKKGADRSHIFHLAG